MASAAAALADGARDTAREGQALGPSGGGEGVGGADKRKWAGALPAGEEGKVYPSNAGEGGGETSCKGSLWVLMTGDARQVNGIYWAIGSLGPDHQELEGGGTEEGPWQAL